MKTLLISTVVGALLLGPALAAAADTPAERRHERQERREDRRDARQDRREHRQDVRQERRNWRQNRAEIRRDLRRAFRAERRYHRAWHAPRGYRYVRWNYGQHLPRAYWARNYWITDWLSFGLIAPPVGLVWVRYGPDALLIDPDTGEIVRVVYGLYY